MTIDLRDTNALQQVRQAAADRKPYVRVTGLQAAVKRASRKGGRK